jgi:putrescine transport system permease protein
LLVWSKVKLGVTPDINALATLMVLTVGIGVIVAGIVLNRAEKNRLNEERQAFQSND